jgi:hypothetical protein
MMDGAGYTCAMVTRQKPDHLTQQKFEEHERWLELYLEMRDHHHQEWFAIAKGQLFRSAEREAVIDMLHEAGIEDPRVLLDFMPHGPPYWVCQH